MSGSWCRIPDMNFRNAFAIPLAILLYLGTGIDVAYAKESKEQKRERKAAEQQYAQDALRRGEILPMARILEISRTYVPGDLIKVELDNRKLVYKVTILTAAGQIRKLELNARDGAFVKIDNK